MTFSILTHSSAPASQAGVKIPQNVSVHKETKTMKQAIIPILLGTSILASGAAFSEDIYAVLPPHMIDDQKTLETYIQTAWDETGRGDSLTVINGQTAETIINVSIPDKGRYDIGKFKLVDFKADLARLGEFVSSANEAPAPVATNWQTNIPAVGDRIAELRVGTEEVGRVLMLGSPLLRVDYNPTLSMISNDSEIKVASDGFILGNRMLSPYGQPEQKAGLNGLSVDFCAVLPPISAHEQAQVARQWGHIIALQGGQLTSFTTDTQTCLKRFKARVSKPLNYRPLDAAIEPVMIGADLSGEATQITIGAMDDLNEARDQAEKRIEELEAELTGQISKTEGLTKALDHAQEERDDAWQELEGIKTVLGQTKETEGSEVLDFSKFTYVQHPRIDELTIATGVSYDDGLSRYTSAWCYFQKINDEGARIRFDIGSKMPGMLIKWEGANEAVLFKVGLTPDDFKVARQSCRFPKD